MLKIPADAANNQPAMNGFGRAEPRRASPGLRYVFSVAHAMLALAPGRYWTRTVVRHCQPEAVPYGLTLPPSPTKRGRPCHVVLEGL